MPNTIALSRVVSTNTPNRSVNPASRIKIRVRYISVLSQKMFKLWLSMAHFGSEGPICPIKLEVLSEFGFNMY